MHIIETAKQLAADGGVIMWPLAATSSAIWFLLTYRALNLLNHRFCTRTELNHLGAILGSGKPIETTSEFDKLAGIQREIVLSLSTSNRGKWRSILADWEEFCRRQMPENGKIIQTLISIAPLLGLLGTVWGMIETFNVISVVGTSEPKLIARGISIAMLTTLAGLLIAVPAIYIEGRIARWEQKIIRRVDETRLVLTKFLTPE